MSFKKELETFGAHVTRALGPKARVVKNDEGWPMVPGKYGQLEWRGTEWRTGEHRLYAYTHSRRMITKLYAILGVRRCQIGDDEAAFWLRADDRKAIQAVASLLRLRRRTSRVWTQEQRETAARRLTQARLTAA